MELFYKPSEAAKFLGVAKITVKRWKKDGKLIPDIVDATGHFLYSQEQLLKIKNGIMSTETVSQNGIMKKNNQEMIPNDTILHDTILAETVSSIVQNGAKTVSSVSEVQNGITSEKNKAADLTADISQAESTTIYKNSQSKFDISEQIAAVKRLDPQTLLNRGVLYPARKDGIICLCGNGSGGNGKGTLTKLVLTCLGDFAVSFPIEGILESGRFVDANAATPAFNSLLFNRLAISEEIPAGKKLNAAKFKILTGGDPLPVRQLYQEMTVIKDPTHTMIFSGNHLPELEDAHDPGILRRLLNIHFTQSFTGDKCDEGLKQRLLIPDSLNGLLALLVENAQEWYKSGLIISDAMKKARQNYLDSQDFIADFINEHCKRDPQSAIPRTEFLNA